MSVVDLHPEDLLDRAHGGSLTSVETERLERHLAQCVACRLEHRSRTDFERFESEEGHDAADFDVQRLLSEVLAPGTDRELLRPPVRRSARGRRWHSMLVVAATLLVAGAAAAAGWTGVRVFRAPPVAAAPVAAASVAAVPAVVAPDRPNVPPLVVARPSAEDAVSPAEELFAPPIDAKLHPVDVPDKHAVARTETAIVRPPPMVLGRVDAPVGVASREAPILAPPPLPDAASLFDHANRARRSGDHARATELYLQLINRFPLSSEGHESEAVLGHLLLHDGDAGPALAHLDEYLRTGGSLTEDVTLDRALALWRLGRASEEAEAWRKLLREYPSSVHSERARQRLEELGRP